MSDNHNMLDFTDPGEMDESLLKVPGFIGEVADYTLRQSFSPNLTLATIGAIALTAHLAGRSYRDVHGTRTNQYFVALGETGIGKDAARSTNARILSEVGQLDSLLDTVASGEGLEDRLIATPSLFLQADEVETMFSEMKRTNKTGSSISDRFRRLYSASAGNVFARAKAGREGAMIVNPHLTFYGTGTPDAFYDSLNERSIMNGMFGRCLVVKAKDEYLSASPTPEPVPASILDAAKILAGNERRILETGTMTPVVVPETPEAAAKMRSINDTLMLLRKRYSESDLQFARALTVRMSEKIAKCALIYAIGANVEAPVVDAGAIEWATAFVNHVTKSMLFECQFHVSEGAFDRLMKRFVAMLAKAGGPVDRSTLLKNLHVDAGMFTRITKTLHMADVIEEEVVSRRKVLFMLKSAA